MKKIIFLVFFAFPTVGICQNKFAVLVTRLPFSKIEDKVVARNNFNLIYQALKIQQYHKENILYDTINNKKESVLNLIRSLKRKLKPNDFIFFYFDLPMQPSRLDKKEPAFVLNNVNRDKFNDEISATELNNLIKESLMLMDNTISEDSRKYFCFFEGDRDYLEITNFKWQLNSCFACSEGQKSFISSQYKSSLFTRAISKSLTDETTFITNIGDFCNNIKKNILLYSINQKIEYEYSDYVDNNGLFNGTFKQFLPHFIVNSDSSSTQITLNAGLNLNVLPGAIVKFYAPYSDTTNDNFLGDGIVSNSMQSSCTVILQYPIKNAWAYISGNPWKVNSYKLIVNTSFKGNVKMKPVFDRILGHLEENNYRNQYLDFTSKGGDIQISNISLYADSTYEVIVSNPNTGMIYLDKKNVSGNDPTWLDDFIRQNAKYQYLSKIENYVPELDLDFEMIYKNEDQKIQRENGYDILYNNDEAYIKLINKGAVKLYYAIIDLQPDRIFNVLLPDRAVGMYPEECSISPFATVSLKKLLFTITPPFGIERFKIITSTQPIYSVEGFNDGNILTRGTSKSSFNPEFFNIKNFDFEIRNNVFAKESDTQNAAFVSLPTTQIIVSEMASLPVKYSVTNNSQGKLYFNLLKLDANGDFSLIFPDSIYSQNDCYAEKGGGFKYEIPAKNIEQNDQLLTIYSDRPFDLNNFQTREKKFREIVLGIIKQKQITGTSMNKVNIIEDTYTGVETGARKGNDDILIKIITPKMKIDRGAEVSDEQDFEINGIAVEKGNRPLSKITINGSDVEYDKSLNFFEYTFSLVEGDNHIVIQATNENGFTASKSFDIKLNKENAKVVGKGKNYFLGIGINNYKTWSPLRNAKNDVIDFANLLEQKFDFAQVNVDTLMDENATRRNIINRIRSYLTIASPNDNIIIYLSGHGNSDQLADGGYYFIPADADKDDVSSAVAASDIIENFKKIKAKQCVLIVDACYSGMITNETSSSNTSIKPLDANNPIDEMSSKWIITSGRATSVSDGKGDNSPFALTLINYLKEHDLEQDLKISKLIEYLEEKVPQISTPPQIPYGVRIDGLGEMTFKITPAHKE